MYDIVYLQYFIHVYIASTPLHLWMRTHITSNVLHPPGMNRQLCLRKYLQLLQLFPLTPMISSRCTQHRWSKGSISSRNPSIWYLCNSLLHLRCVVPISFVRTNGQIIKASAKVWNIRSKQSNLIQFNNIMIKCKRRELPWLQLKTNCECIRF